MAVLLEFDPTRQTCVVQSGFDAGRTVKRYAHQAVEHPIRLTDNITIWAGSQVLIPDAHWQEFLDHPNPNVRNRVIPQMLKDGVLKVIKVTDANDSANSLIGTLGTSEAVTMIEQTFDATMLSRWKNEDPRQAIQNAIARQESDIKKEAGIDAKATSAKTAK